MLRTGLSALAFIGIAIGTDCRAERVFINLRPQAEVDRAEVRLTDIAEIATRNSNVAEQLGSTVVFKCPSLASLCRLGKSDVVAVTQARAQQLGANLIWGSNEGVTVRGRMRPLSLMPAADRAAIRILQQMDQGYPLAVSIQEGPGSIDVPPGIAEFRPEFDQMRWVGSAIELPIHVLVDGASVAKPVIRYALRRSFVSAPPEELATERLTSDSAVAKNKKVRLLIGSGPVRIEAEGIALADADLGGTVRVRRPNGLADVRGRAIDRGTVLVEEN